MIRMQIKVNESGKRIDVFLLDEISLSRNQIQKAIKNKQVLVNGDEVKTNYVVKENDIILTLGAGTVTEIGPMLLK